MNGKYQGMFIELDDLKMFCIFLFCYDNEKFIVERYLKE